MRGYSRLGEISQGGMGYVELVVRREGHFQRFHARKRLYPQYRQDPGFRAMFLDEARLAGLVHHPNVVAVIDAGEDADGPYFVTELVDGVPLGRVVARLGELGKRLPVQLAARFALETARGLHAAHEAVAPDGQRLALVHRDVSPQNILVGFDGTVRVTDFGIAKAAGNRSRTSAGVLKGNVGYLSPEQLRFEEADRRADLFALGVVLFELLSGTRLYESSEEAQGIRRILDEPPPDVAEHRPDVPPKLVELVFELLAKRREKRPATARDVALRLEEILAALIVEQGALDAQEFMEATFAAEIVEQRTLRQRQLERAPDPEPGASAVAVASAVERSRRWRWPAVAAAAVVLLGIGAAMRARSTPPADPRGAIPPSTTTATQPLPASPRTVWAGSWHTCATDDGVLFCWGKNSEGQLGVGQTLDFASRRRVDGVPPVASVGAGAHHTCACDRAGAVHCWGRNAEGQLGTGAASTLVPARVEGAAACAQIVAGARHTCLLDRTGAVWCWGANTHGQAGAMATDSVPRPARVPALERIVELDADGDFSCARRDDGAVLCWGANGQGQLGARGASRATPEAVVGVAGATALALGAEFACVIQSRGAVACWGANGMGQLGVPSAAEGPAPIDGVAGGVQIAAGNEHVCLIDGSGGMRCWGANNFGQLGDGSTQHRARPTAVVNIPSRWHSVALGAVHTCARSSLGLACWGRNGTAQLGDGTSDDRARPVSVVGFRDAE